MSDERAAVSIRVEHEGHGSNTLEVKVVTGSPASSGALYSAPTSRYHIPALIEQIDPDYYQ